MGGVIKISFELDNIGYINLKIIQDDGVNLDVKYPMLLNIRLLDYLKISKMDSEAQYAYIMKSVVGCIAKQLEGMTTLSEDELDKFLIIS